MYSIAGRVVEEPGTWIHKEIEIAAEMGVQAFMVDAGWYGDEFGSWWNNRGDWWVGKWLPGGLKACRDLCHEHGMLFGLWMEPECVGPKSKLLKEHPDWLLRTDNGREVAEHDPWGRFRFGIPPKTKGDLAFVQHMIATLNLHGQLGVVMPHGVLFRGGKEKLFGFFVGQVMKATQGKANPQLVNELLKKMLAG